MYCKHCGKEIADDSKFCNYCGKLLATDKEQSADNDKKGNAFGKFVTTNKKYILLYAIWFVLNVLLFCFSQSNYYYIENPQELFYPFTDNKFTYSFYVGYYDITEFIVYVILMPLIIYYYLKYFKKHKKKSEPYIDGNDKDVNSPNEEIQVKQQLHSPSVDNSKDVFMKHNEDSAKKRVKAKHNDTRFVKILKLIFYPFHSPSGVLECIIIILGLVGLHFHIGLGLALLAVALIAYPYLLCEYLDKDEAEGLIGNPRQKHKIQIILARIILFESMFASIEGALFVCSISWSIIEYNTVKHYDDVVLFSGFVAFISFIYILYQYRKAISKCV